MHNLLPNNHIFLQSARFIEEISRPLTRFGILHFTYLKNFNNGKQINLSNHAQWLEDYYQLALYESSRFEALPHSYETGYRLWPNTSSPLLSPVLAHGRDYFDSDHGITVIRRLPTSCEFYFFSASHNNPEIINFYLNNFDILQRFVFYFHDKAAKLLRQAAEHKILLPPHVRLNSATEERNSHLSFPQQLVDLKTQFQQETKIKRYYFNEGKNESVYLTPRESACITALLNQKTAVETAHLLQLSPRTVECHLENIKIKLNCSTKKELVAKLLKTPFIAL